MQASNRKGGFDSRIRTNDAVRCSKVFFILQSRVSTRPKETSRAAESAYAAGFYNVSRLPLPGSTPGVSARYSKDMKKIAYYLYDHQEAVSGISLGAIATILAVMSFIGGFLRWGYFLAVPFFAIVAISSFLQGGQGKAEVSCGAHRLG